MKKNGQYVGVDEKYIPEDEKYVDESLLGSNEEVKEKINDSIDKAKPYAKKGLKIAKNMGIGYLIFIGLIFVMFITIFVFAIINISKASNMFDDPFDKINEQFDKTQDKNNYSEVEKKAFNSEFELYSGTKSAFLLESLLDDVVTNNKTEKDHIITVIYGETTTIKPDEIVKIKYELEDDIEYEISLNYDTNGFVNEVVIVAL